MENKKQEIFYSTFIKNIKTPTVVSVQKDRNEFTPKFIKSGEYVKWQSEKNENTCHKCSERNGRLYKAEDAASELPVHKNCRCKLVSTVAVEAGMAAETGLLSGLENEYILGNERTRKIITAGAEKYIDIGERLPQKQNRKYYKIKAGEGVYLIVSDDGLCFAAYNNFRNIYPVENSALTEKKRKEKEALFFGGFEREIELFEKNELAPMAYTYIMKNLYNWYATEDAAEMAMTEARLEEFRKTGYKYTGVESYDKLIEEMPKRPTLVLDSEVHYLRNRLNVEYSWKSFEKMNDKLPERYRWEQMSELASMLHQNTATSIKPNRKYVSFDGYFEAVYSYDNKLLNEKSAPVDMGTYNYNPSTAGKLAFLGHFVNDMLPYYDFKNSEKDRKEAEKKQWELLKEITKQ